VDLTISLFCALRLGRVATHKPLRCTTRLDLAGFVMRYEWPQQLHGMAGSAQGTEKGIDMKKPMPWSEASLTKALVRQFFQNSVLAVPCCGWTGHEADLLVVSKDCRLIDVEMKISRSDFKADAKKDKWWRERPWSRSRRPSEPSPREWPPKIWKHYYLIPTEVWTPELAAFVPAASGILLASGSPGRASIASWRRSKPNRDAEKLLPHEVIDIARLAGLRLWDALERIDRLQPLQGNEHA